MQFTKKNKVSYDHALNHIFKLIVDYHFSHFKQNKS
jgi:hypothetical protein